MIILLIIWFTVGIVFGFFRAKRIYILCVENGDNKLEALFSAAVSLLIWTTMGLITGISFAAWIAFRVMDDKNVSNKGRKEFGLLWDLTFLIITYLAFAHSEVRSHGEIQ